MTDLAVLEHAPPICRDCATLIAIGADRCPSCGTPLCTRCGVTISEREEGRCAFCRMADRGDDALLSHDERGWIGVTELRQRTPWSKRQLVETRIPCGCGCGMVEVPDPPRPDPEEAKPLPLLQPAVVYTRVECLQAICDWAADHDGEPPSISEWNAAGCRPSHSTIADRCGGWSTAIREAGFEPKGGRQSGGWKAKPIPGAGRHYKHWTREEIIEAIRGWAAEHGKPPSADDWRQSTEEHPTQMTVRNHFGSWSKGIIAAGVGVRSVHALPREEPPT